MIPTPETSLPEQTFDPRCNSDLAEVIGYLGLLKEKGYDNGYRVGIVTNTIFGQGVEFGVQYTPGETVIFKDARDRLGSLVVGNMPEIYDGSIPSNMNKILNPHGPIEGVPKEYIREVI